MTLNDIGNSQNNHGVIPGDDPDQLRVGLGETFSFVSGIGGKSIRNFTGDPLSPDPWWGAVYTTNFWKNSEKTINQFNGALPGALFITFNVDGDPYKAHGEFVDILGGVIDSFWIRSTFKPTLN